MQEKTIVAHKRAYYDYEILQEYECGMILKGSEVKSIKEKNIMFTDSFVLIKDRRISMVNCHIGRYRHDSLSTSSGEKRPIELLLQKNEIQKISKQITTKGLTLIPLKIIQRQALLKLRIAVCRGKKEYQKKESIKDRTMTRETERIVSQHIRKGKLD